MISSRDYSALGIEKGNKYVIPAFLAAVYQQSLDDNASWDKVRSAGNYVAIGAAVIAAPFTEGASWATYSTIIAGIFAAADEALKSQRMLRGSSREYDAKYEDFWRSWEAFYQAAMLLDGFANTPQLIRSLRAISFAKSARPLSAAAESYGKQATVAVLWRQTGRLVKKESLLSDLVVRNKQLGELLLKTKLAQGDKATSEVVTVFFLEKHQRKVSSKGRRTEHLVDR